MFSITVIVFSTTIISFYSLIDRSEKIAMRESFEIQGGGHATKITTIDTMVNISNSYGGTVNLLEYDFSIPTSIAGKTYVTTITGNQIVMESDNGAKGYVPLNSTSSIIDQKIYSGIQDLKFIYNRTSNNITVGAQYDT